MTLSTSRPDGYVIRGIKARRTQWRIAIQYGTTVKQIKRLINLNEETVVQVKKLLVQRVLHSLYPR